MKSEFWAENFGGCEAVLVNVPASFPSGMARLVYCWETVRKTGETWESFVERSGIDTLTAVERWPMSEDLPPDLSGLILYNLSYVSSAEFDALQSSNS